MKNNRMKNALENIARRGVPENTNLMPRIAAQLERKSPMMILRTRPFAAIVIALLILLALSGAAYALGRVFGYVPGVGLVENNSGMRVLVEPASVTRDGVTLTVTQALVYQDHVQLIYEVSGIAPENNSYTFSNADLNSIDQKAFCGPGSSPRDGYLSDGDARLRLPDGTLVDRVFGTDKYPENVFAMKPAYETSIPVDVTELTMVLECIPWTRLGAVPENWEVLLKLKYVPADTVVGEPVLDVTPSGTSSVHDHGITVALDKVVPQDDLYSFYFTLIPDEKKESLSALSPAPAYLIDSTGQKISLIDTHPPSGFHDTAEPWELQTVSKPAYGPYTLVLDRVDAHYQETGSEFFEFDTGLKPQVGQTWTLNKTLHLSGTDVRVISATIVEKDLAAWGLSENTQLLEFSFEAVDGKTPFQLDIMGRDLNHIKNGILPVSSGNGEPATNFTTALFYEKGIPAGKIPVAINGQTIIVTGNWKLQWTSPDQTGAELFDAVQPVSSKPGASGVTAELKRVVKLDDGYLFYIHMTAPEQRPDFKVIAPVEVFVIDSTGQKIKLNLDGPQVYSARNENLWQLSTKEKIAAGPLKLVVEKAKAYYSNFNFDYFDSPPSDEMLQQTIEEHSFIFDAGAEPHIGQTWALNQEFEVGGYKGKVVSARAVLIDSHLLDFKPFPVDESINKGYEFTIASVDSVVQWNVDMSIGKPKGDSGSADCIYRMDGDPGSTTTHTVPCRGLPYNKLQVTINEISVLLDEVWEIDWNPPAP